MVKKSIREKNKEVVKHKRNMLESKKMRIEA